MVMFDDFRYSANKHVVADLAIYQCGHEKCNKGHLVRAVRNHYIIHYIVKGRGTFISCGKKYELSKGDGFLILPDINTVYLSCEDDPWEYYWVGFYGTEASKLLQSAGLDMNNLVFHNENNDIQTFLSKMHHNAKCPSSSEIETLGCFYIFMSKLIETKDQGITTSNYSDLYLENAKDYIMQNYLNPLSVQTLADFIGIERSYLYRIFKINLGMSPLQYINSFRITKACELIKSTNLSIEEVAKSVGYDNISHFYKNFKKYTNITPNQYKNLNTNLKYHNLVSII